MDVIRLVALIFCCCFLKRTTSTTAFPTNNEESSPDLTSTVIDKKGENLDGIPQGTFAITEANFAYNNIAELSPYVLYVNLYRNLEHLRLGHNKIVSIDVDAFKEARQLRTLDLSSNNLSYIDSNTFRHNHRLEKLDLASNCFTFDPEKAFLRSFSIQTLVLSNNQIARVFDVTFARLPNVRTIMLDANPLYQLDSYCFVHSRRLQYINVANTEIERLTYSMFRTLPRLMDLGGTVIAKRFKPPLTRVKSEQLIALIDTETRFLGVDYDT